MSTETRRTSRQSRHKSRAGAAGPSAGRGGISGAVKALLVVVLAVAVLAAIFVMNSSKADAPTSAGSNGLAGKYAFQVGRPGPGQPAPPMQLPSTSGGTFDLASQRGQTVLLYFQEGIMCQPCWDQLKDIESSWADFQALGVDKIVSITSDPLNALQQKVELEGLSTPLLSDPGITVSRTYEANNYGMMGQSMNGHSFVLVDENGIIRWRADYGGAPKYTMYVPVPNLLADLQQGISKGSR